MRSCEKRQAFISAGTSDDAERVHQTAGGPRSCVGDRQLVTTCSGRTTGVIDNTCLNSGDTTMEVASPRANATWQIEQF